MISGTGSIGLATGAAVTFQAGAILSPGLGPGTLTVVGDLTMADNSIYLWELGPAAYDTTIVTGELTLGEWILRVADAGGTAHPSDKFYLFTSGGTFTDVGTPTIDWSLVPLWGVNTDPDAIVFDTDAGGLYVTGLSSTPEPATLTLLALGGLALWRRRRRAA